MIQYFQTQHCLFYNHLGSTWDPSCAAAGPLLCRWVLWPGRLTKDLGKSFVTSNMSFLHPFGLHVGLHVGLPPGLPKWLTDIQQTNRLVQGITYAYTYAYTRTYTYIYMYMPKAYGDGERERERYGQTLISIHNV